MGVDTSDRLTTLPLARSQDVEEQVVALGHAAPNEDCGSVIDVGRLRRGDDDASPLLEASGLVRIPSQE